MPHPPAATLDRRRATDADRPFLLALRRDAMGDHLRAAGLPDSDAEHHERIAHRFDAIDIITVDGRAVGMVKTVRAAGCWEILQFQLAREVRGGGLGGRVLDQLIAEAAADAADLSLRVLRDNPARNLYLRAGFQVVAGDRLELHLRRFR
jgi:GNAT superfamily N-acetyltransferase